MSAVDKILKKVEQERGKGNADRALARLKEAITGHPREFVLAREAALIAFEIGKTLEAVGILRAAMRRCPQERGEALAMARFEFDTNSALEVGELLYDSYLAQPDFDQAREVITALSEPDQDKLLTKLRTRIQSMHESVPEEKRRLLGLRLAEAIALSAMQRPAEVAASLTQLVELDSKQVEMVGRLCKFELRKAAGCVEIRLLLARCYLLVNEPALAAEQLLVNALDPDFRKQVYRVLEQAEAVAPLEHVRGVLQLLDEEYGPAHETLTNLLQTDPSAISTVRQTLERIPEALESSDQIRLMYAEVLAKTAAISKSLQEIAAVFEKGDAPEACLEALDALLKIEAQNTQARRLRAKIALQLGQADAAVQDLRKAIEAGGSRAVGLKSEIEEAFEHANCDAQLGRTLVELYVDDDEPQKAADVLDKMHTIGESPAAELFELAGTVAGKYGFTSVLASLFVESALDIERGDDARAAMSHYLTSPGARVDEFTTSLSGLIQRRGDLAQQIAAALEDLEIPSELRVQLVRARFEAGEVDSAIGDLQALVAADSQLTRQAQTILEEHLASHEDSATVLEFLAELRVDQHKIVDAAELLARAIVCDPTCSDRVCRKVDDLLAADPSQHEIWRPIVNALVDVDRLRHAREMCYQAAQTVAPDQQGFLHAALARVHRDTGQVETTIQELKLASECVDAPWQRIHVDLNVIVELDPQHGYAHLLLGRTMLALGESPAEAVELLGKAVALDNLTHEMALEALREHRESLADLAEAHVLEGTLLLKKGDRPRGVAMLREALAQSPESGEAVLRILQVQWDQDPDDVDTGLVLSQALLGVNQLRRACRLLSDLAERFPDQREVTIGLLQEVLEKKPIAEAHKALWDIHLQKGDRQMAVHHVQLALEDLAADPEAYQALLETAHRQVPESVWVTCRMAEIVLAEGNDSQAEQLLRALVEADLSAADEVVRVVQPGVGTCIELALLEVDALLASNQWMAALQALRNLKEHFADSDDSATERYRVLMDRGDTELAANLDFGMLLREAGHIEDATRVFEKTLEQAAKQGVADKEHQVRLALASLYADLGREAEGKELLAAVIDEAEDSSEAYRFIEQVTRKSLLGKLKKLQGTIRQSPGNLRARIELAKLSLVSGDFNSTREALSFTGDSPVIEATRSYLLARSYSDDDQPQLAVAVLRSIAIDDVADDELRRNIVYLLATCSEQLGQYGEAHARYLRLLSECPGYKDTHKRARTTYQKHLETSLETHALVLEKRTSVEMS